MFIIKCWNIPLEQTLYSESNIKCCISFLINKQVWLMINITSLRNIVLLNYDVRILMSECLP